jgi:hypothetical protein
MGDKNTNEDKGSFVFCPYCGASLSKKFVIVFH